MKYILVFLIIVSTTLISCDSNSKSASSKDSTSKTLIIQPIPIDVKSISGLDLKPVTNQNEPERRLFQKRMLRGLDLSVYVVSSETASAAHESYGIDEFLYLINGQARMNPENAEEQIFNTGEFFIAPKGFNGEWETRGGDEFLIELSVISTDRFEGEIDPNKTLPYLLDKDKLSGIGITKTEGADHLAYSDKLYEGAELNVDILAEESESITHIENLEKEQLIHVISGAVDIEIEGRSNFTFYRGDFFLLPRSFNGKMKAMGHGLCRYLRVTKSFE